VLLPERELTKYIMRTNWFLGNGLENKFHGNGYTCNNKGTVGNGVFYAVHAKGL
jgi:hypothetical protein